MALIYSKPPIYHLTMRMLYGRYFEACYTALASLIPDGTQVIDVCAGDGYLYRKYLKFKNVDYLGLDNSPQMVVWMQRRGVRAQMFDFWREAVPKGEILVLQASLYQFTPHAMEIVNRLLNAARRYVIISEPIVNLSSSSKSILARLSHHLTIPASSQASYLGQRFTRSTFTQLLESIPSLRQTDTIPGGREMIALFECAGSSRGDGFERNEINYSVD